MSVLHRSDLPVLRSNPALAPGGRGTLLRKPFICAPAGIAARLGTAPRASESPAGEARVVRRLTNH